MTILGALTTGCKYYATYDDAIYLRSIDSGDYILKTNTKEIDEIKKMIVDYLNSYSDYEIKIYSDSLITTFDTIAKPRNKNWAKYGYQINVIKIGSNEYKISTHCFTNSFGSEIARSRNEKIILYYILTKKLNTTYINNPKKIIYIGPRYGPCDDCP